MSPFPAVEDLIGHCLKLLCDPNDAERAFVDFNDGDTVALVVNNYGGLSNLELGALTDETIQQLGEKGRERERERERERKRELLIPRSSPVILLLTFMSSFQLGHQASPDFVGCPRDVAQRAWVFDIPV